MSERKYTATKLKAELLRVLDEVETTRQPVLVTKHGRSVARVVPVDAGRELIGSVTFHVSDDELIDPIGERWLADE